FYYLLKALDLPAGSEIIFPSLTFWVVPELARVAGLTVVFADVDPRTFNIDPDSAERLVTDRTRAIVPTHLYGLPCDMDRLLDLALSGAVGVGPDRRQPRRLSLGKNPIASSAPRTVRRALPERAGGDRSRSVEASRQLDRAGAGQRGVRHADARGDPGHPAAA